MEVTVSPTHLDNRKYLCLVTRVWNRTGLENFECCLMLGPWKRKCVIGHGGLVMVVAANQMNWGRFVNSHREAIQTEQETEDDLFSSCCLALVTLISYMYKGTSWTQFLELKGGYILLIKAGQRRVRLLNWICGGNGEDWSAELTSTSGLVSVQPGELCATGKRGLESDFFFVWVLAFLLLTALQQTLRVSVLPLGSP